MASSVRHRLRLLSLGRHNLVRTSGYLWLRKQHYLHPLGGLDGKLRFWLVLGLSHVSDGLGLGTLPVVGTGRLGLLLPIPYYVPVCGGVAWRPGGWAATSGNVYRRYGNTGAVTRTSQGFNAWTGNQWASQVGMSYNSRNGSIAAGQRAAVHNVNTGDYAYGGRGAVTSGATGKTYTGDKLTVGNSESGQSGSAGNIRGDNGGIARVGDNVHAARDGTVYRRGESGWEQNSGGGWNSADRPASSGSGQNRAEALQGAAAQRRQAPSSAQMPSSQQIQSLNRQSEARSMEEMRTMSNRNFAGGGMRMGGRRR